ncbi:MAG: thioredoxin fold domain-containing protein [Planctomycetes bacterium]|nr:thioredoxin fold domain-containing protein [Planctomycetota bacterium]
MRLLVSSALLLALTAGAARADAPGWIMGEYQKALDAGKKSGRLVQVDWTAEWCGWCKKLEKETYSDAEVQKYINATFINVRMDKDKNAELAAKLNVGGIPALLFIDGDGRIVGRIVGFRAKEPYLKAVKEIQANALKLKGAEEALKKDANDLKSRLAAGQVWSAADDWATAEPHLKAVIEGDKDNAKKLAVGAWYEMGKHSAATNDATGARSAQEMVKTFDPDNKSGFNDNLDLMVGRTDAGKDAAKAREVYKKIVAAYPASDGAAESAFFLAALLADADKDFDGAKVAFAKMAKDYPGTEWADRVPDILKKLDDMKAAGQKK